VVRPDRCHPRQRLPRPPRTQGGGIDPDDRGVRVKAGESLDARITKQSTADVDREIRGEDDFYDPETSP
jgi:hypothetical protein